MKRLNSGRSRIKRLLLGVFLPAIIGALIFVIEDFFRSIVNDKPLVNYFEIFPFILLFAYMFVGIQSVIYSLIMEFLVNNRIKNNIVVVLLSTVLGILSGIIFLRTEFIITGAITGFVMGVGLRRSYNNSIANNVSNQ